MILPTECVESIVLFLAPQQRFHVATDCRFLFIQRRYCLPWLRGASMDYASGKGQTDLLEAWKTSGFESLEYTCFAMDWATFEGHVDVLNWWKTSGLEMKHCGWWDNSFARTSIIDYHKHHEPPLAVERALSAIRVVQWWNDNILSITTE